MDILNELRHFLTLLTGLCWTLLDSLMDSVFVNSLIFVSLCPWCMVLFCLLQDNGDG